MSKFDYINKSLAKFREEGKQEWQYRRSAKMLGELRFKSDKILELAKPFTNSTQMVNYKGKNQKQINMAGRYIEHKYIPRPKWFDEVIKNNQETVEECVKILSKISTIEEIRKDDNYKRLLNRLWLFKSKNEVQELLPHLNWKRINWDDDSIYSILSTYKTTVEVRNAKIHKKFLTKLQVDKGKKYPKSYALYIIMQVPKGNKFGSKRGKYNKNK